MMPIVSHRGYKKGCKNLHDFVNRISTSQVFDKLARRKVTGKIKGATVLHSLSPIELLPPELLAEVLSNDNLTKEDVASFGICSQTIWMHTLVHIRANYEKSIGNWIGVPLICTGSFLWDLPLAVYELFPDILDAERVFDATLKYPNLSRGCPTNGCCPARSWNYNAITSYQNIKNQNVKMEWRKAVCDARAKDSGASEPLMKDIEDILCVEKEPSQVKWILRNLTCKKFVRLDVEQKADRILNVFVAKTALLSLDKFLMTKICWSEGVERQGVSVEKALVQRGEWAGHSFDIVRDFALICGEWNDVTNDILQHAVTLGVMNEPSSSEVGYVGLFSSDISN